MPYDLPLPPPWRAQGWRVKIRENESRETPHVTIWRGPASPRWRVSLRDKSFLMPPGGSRRDIPRAVRRHWALLCGAWDAMYPDNPVSRARER